MCSKKLIYIIRMHKGLNSADDATTCMQLQSSIAIKRECIWLWDMLTEGKACRLKWGCEEAF